jgi:4-alpha-glucanotransferase
MAEANILSYRVLYFERDASGFLAPEQYPRLAVAVAGSHDLPTLPAWWSGADLELKRALNLYPCADDERRALEERRRDRDELEAAFRRAACAGGGTDEDTVFDASHRFLAQTCAALALVQLDDVAGETLPVNVPTTTDEYPNWRRRLSLTLEDLAVSARLSAVAGIMNARKARR